MNTKLTLTVEENIIRQAKQYARDNKRSLSDLVENYLKILAHSKVKQKDELTPVVKSLKGSFSAPQNINYKKELAKRLSEKYL